MRQGYSWSFPAESRTAVTVGAVSAPVIPLVDLRHREVWVVEAINDDLAQTIDLKLEHSFDGVAPWYVVDEDSLSVLGPGEIRSISKDTRGYQYGRVTAKSRGAGGVAARVSSATVYRRAQ